MRQTFAALVMVLSANLVVGSTASASETIDKEVSKLVESKVLASMKTSKKTSRFSRKAPVATARRVRVQDATEKVDARGDRFVEFTIQDRLRAGSAWQDEMTGCAYLVGQRVYVLRNEAYYDGATIGSKREATPVEVVCRAVPASAAAPATPAAVVPSWLVSTVRSLVRLVVPGTASPHVTA
jgi:hypothetical protein